MHKYPSDAFYARTATNLIFPVASLKTMFDSSDMNVQPIETLQKLESAKPF